MTQLTDFTKLLKDANAATGPPADGAEQAADWIRALKQQAPAIFHLVMTFINQSPQEVIDALGMWDYTVRELRTSPRALMFVRALQERLRGKENG